MVSKIEKFLILVFWAILSVFIVPVIMPLLQTGNAMMSMILIVVVIAFVIIFPIALIYHKED